MKRRDFLAGLSAVLTLAPQVRRAAASAWPEKPLTLIIPFAAGGPSDASGRYLASELEKLLGQPVIAENVGGAAGSIGIGKVAHAAPDGYVIGLGHTGTFSVNPYLQPDIPYDPLKDFTTIARMTAYTSVLFSNPDRPFATLAEFIAAAKAAPKTLTYGSAGPGSTNHLAMEQFAHAAGIELVHVPYKGYAPARTDLMAGVIDVMFDVWSATGADLIATGKLNGLGSTAREPVASQGDIPLISGTLPGFSTEGWTGILGPVGLPADVVARLDQAIAEILARPGSVEAMRSYGYETFYEGPKAFATRIAVENAEFGVLIKSLGLAAK
jgi:tripartite-type tricarboxylate transporter receptor subunit TctC